MGRRQRIELLLHGLSNRIYFGVRFVPKKFVARPPQIRKNPREQHSPREVMNGLGRA